MRAEHHRPGWFYDHVAIRWQSALSALRPGVTLRERRHTAQLARQAAQLTGVTRVTWPTLDTPGGWRGVDKVSGPTAAGFSVVLADGPEADLTEVAGSVARLIEDADTAGFDLRVRLVHERGAVMLDNTPLDVHREAAEVFGALVDDARVGWATVAYQLSPEATAASVGDVVVVHVCLKDAATEDALGREWGSRTDGLAIPPANFSASATC
ncbi:hypothetical protein [Oerskovia turbata]